MQKKVTKWLPRSNQSVERQKVAEVMDTWNISETFAKILIGRTDIEDLEQFLVPCEKHLHSPFLFEDMEKAVDRIISAMNNHEKIVIYGDYDVDGITATTIILHYFKALGYENISYYIPHRTEGYGVNEPAIRKTAEEGGNLIITVDCGITSCKEVDLINELGMEVILTDHHEQGETIPDAYAVIDPKKLDTTYPFKGLCGAGVAYKLMVALHSKITNKPNFSNNLDEFFDLVAFATIADIVPLLDENRYLVQKGLRLFAPNYENKREIFSKLIEVAGLNDKAITSESIGFQLAPRINAIGRIDSADVAVEYFNFAEGERLSELAILLNKKNEDRKTIENRLFEEVLKQIPPVEECEQFTIVVADDRVHTGVKGLIASKTETLYKRPVIICNVEDGYMEGSCRSTIDGFDMKKALDYCSDLLVKYGGHTHAAGLTVTKENFEAFKNRFEEYARNSLKKEDLVPCYEYDAEINANHLTNQLMRDVELFAPYGEANPSPRFVIRNATVVKKFTMGTNNAHLKLKVVQNGITVTVVAFHMGYLYDSIPEEGMVDVLFIPMENTWQGKTEIQMQAEDIKIHGIDVEPVQPVNSLRETYVTELVLRDNCPVMPNQELMLWKEKEILYAIDARGVKIGVISPKIAATVLNNCLKYNLVYKVLVTDIVFMDNEYHITLKLDPVALK